MIIKKYLSLINAKYKKVSFYNKKKLFGKIQTNAKKD